MNKKLITLAVAAAVAAPMTALADVTIYGKANVSYDAVKCDGGDRLYKVTSNSPVTCADGSGPEGRASRLGFKGSEDLGSGLKAIWKMEFSVDQANNSAVGSSRNAYVGLASDSWGTALIGRHDHPYKMATGKYDYFADQLGDFNGSIGFEDLRAQNVAAYVSPNWAGFSLAAAMVSPGTDDWQEGYSIAGMYSNGGLNVSLAYDKIDKSLLNGDVAFNNWAEKKWTVGASFDMGAFGIAGRYENQDNPYRGGNKIDDMSKWQIAGKFGFGNNVAKAFFGDADFDSDDDFDLNGAGNAWGIGLDHNFTKRSQLYVQWVNVEDSWDGFSLGMTHKF